MFTQVGPLSSVTLNFDHSGRFNGSAQVVFQRQGDAIRAVNKYHNVLLDGRSMRIEVVMSAGEAAIMQAAGKAANAPRSP